MGHPQNGIIVQANTWNGLVRIQLFPNGNFVGWLADEVGDNAVKFCEGNVDYTIHGQHVVKDADGNGLSIQDVKPLSPVMTTGNRMEDATAKHGGRATKRAAATAQTGQAATGMKARTTSTGRVTTTTAAPTATPSQARRPAPQASKPVSAFDWKQFSEGDRVRLVSNPDGSSPALPGETGTVERIKGKTPVGPQLHIIWDNAPAGTVYPNLGDIIESVVQQRKVS